MMRLRKRVNTPDDPLAPVLSRICSTSRPVTESWWMPGLWAGNGRDLAGMDTDSPVDADVLERMLTEAGGGFDIVMAELPAMIKATAIRSGERDEIWYAEFMRYAVGMLPVALAEIWEHQQIDLDLGHARYVAAIFPHPVSCCWDVSADVYHAHALVVGNIWCSCPEPHRL
jgi:hypothetical protein